MTDQEQPLVDQRAFRTAMGQFPTGVTVVSGLAEGLPVGFVAQSFVSLSLDPPLVAVCPGRQSTTWPLLSAGGRYAISVLAADQGELCQRFARSGGNKFADTEWSAGPVLGLPLLAGAIMTVECTLEAEHEAGDHWVAIGAVAGFEVHRPEAPPMVFCRGDFPVLSER